MPESNLKMARCRLCGGTGNTQTAWGSIRVAGRYGIIAVCKSCGAYTQPRYSIEEAIAEWNNGRVVKHDTQAALMSIFDQEFCDG